MGVISSGYTLCNLDTSHKQVTYSTTPWKRLASSQIFLLVPPQIFLLVPPQILPLVPPQIFLLVPPQIFLPTLLTETSKWAWAQGGGVERTPPLCSHVSCIEPPAPRFSPQQLDFKGNPAVETRNRSMWLCGPTITSIPSPDCGLAWILRCWVVPEPEEPSAALAESCKKTEVVELWAKQVPWLPNHIEEKNHRLWLGRFFLILGKFFSSGGTAVLEQVPGTGCASLTWGFPKD